MATPKTIHLSDLHFDNKRWSDELDFCRQEVTLFEKRLGEVAARNTDKDTLSVVEHLQNRFIRENEVIDELMHEINVQESSIVAFAKANPTALDHRSFNDHAILRDKMDSFHKLFQELREEFNRFIAKWL
jgi:hypothetical protein